VSQVLSDGTESLPGWRLSGQGVEQFGRSLTLFDPALQLAFPRHMLELDTSENTLGASNNLKPSIGRVTRFTPR